MYYRLYPSKNNTIFRQFGVDGVSVQNWSASTNTGENTIMELHDGKSQSKLLFGFDIPTWLKAKLDSNDFECNLKVWDAGALFEPMLSLKQLSVTYFTEDFSEGDGWSFLKTDAKAGLSNWEYRQDGQLWSAVTFNSVEDLIPNKQHDDLIFNVKPALDAENNPLNINFALEVSNHVVDADNIYTKFFYSRHSRTVFKPYLEFKIHDEIRDKAYNLLSGVPNKIYFINENGIDFSGAVGAEITLNDNSTSSVIATKERDGVYYVNITPSDPSSIVNDEYVSIIWSIGGTQKYKQVLKVSPRDNFVSGIDYKNLLFYPSSPYAHNMVKHGDVIPFEVMSNLRGRGDVIVDTYQYRVVSMDGFEMVPWTDISVYRDKMYFNINTSYLYPELSYEVIIRNNMSNFQITSNLTHKFKLISSDQSHLRQLNASPYYSREYFFSK